MVVRSAYLGVSSLPVLRKWNAPFVLWGFRRWLRWTGGEKFYLGSYSITMSPNICLQKFWSCGEFLPVAVRYTGLVLFKFNSRPDLNIVWYFHFAQCKWGWKRNLGQPVLNLYVLEHACRPTDCFMVIKCKKGDAEKVTSVVAPIFCLRNLSISSV